MLVSLARCFRTVLAYVPFPAGVAWARWLAGNALTRRLFFARDLRSIKVVYEDSCGIRLDDRAVQRLLMAKTLKKWRVFKILKLSDRDLARYVRINGLDEVRDLNGSGRSVVLMSAHFIDVGCISAVLARLGFDFRSLRRSWPKWHPSYSRVRHIFVGGDRAVPGFKEISAVLKAGGVVYSLFDGLQGTGTVARPFLGRVCHFRRGLIEMAWTAGAAIVPVSVRSDLDGCIRIDFHEPMSVENNDQPKNAWVADITKRLAVSLETRIKAYPCCFDPVRLELFWRRAGVDAADAASS